MSDICCKEFDPKPFQNALVHFEAYTFVEDSVYTFMYMPIFGNFGRAVNRNKKRMQNAGLTWADNEFILTDCASPFKMKLYSAVDFDEGDNLVNNEEIVSFTGRFRTRVYDGPYSEIPNWIKDITEFVEEQNESVHGLYFRYAYCPICAERFGHNYVVIYADIDGVDITHTEKSSGNDGEGEWPL